MKALRLALPALVLVSLVTSCAAIIPNQVSAGQWSGTSPSFAPATSWTLALGTLQEGDILGWYWTSSDNLLFYMIQPDGEPAMDLTNFMSVRLWKSGDWRMVWENRNMFFSATVTYSVLSFTPALTVTTPSEGAYLKSPIVSVQGTYDGYADGVLVGLDALHLYPATVQNMDWGLDGLILPEGQDTILVRWYCWLDAYGNTNLTMDRTVHVTVDLTLPDLAIVTPAGITPSTTTYVRDLGSIVWQCSDENGIASMEVKIDALGWVEVTTDSYPVQLSDGEHIVQVRVTDVAGNEIECVIDFITDNTAPEVTISGPLMNSKISKNEVSLNWEGSDLTSGIDHYEVQVDGGNWKQTSSGTYQIAGLQDGWHSVTVKAVDRAGNAATSTVSFGIYTSIWSQNGPYQGMPLYAMIAAIVLIAVLSVLLYRRKKSAVAAPPSEVTPPEAQ